MSRLLGVVGIYGLMLVGCCAAGLAMLCAPARCGNALNQGFRLYPEVSPEDRGKIFIVRLAGAGLLSFAGWIVWRVSGAIS